MTGNGNPTAWIMGDDELVEVDLTTLRTGQLALLRDDALVHGDAGLATTCATILESRP